MGVRSGGQAGDRRVSGSSLGWLSIAASRFGFGAPSAGRLCRNLQAQPALTCRAECYSSRLQSGSTKHRTPQAAMSIAGPTVAPRVDLDTLTHKSAREGPTGCNLGPRNELTYPVRHQRILWASSRALWYTPSIAARTGQDAVVARSWDKRMLASVAFRAVATRCSACQGAASAAARMYDHQRGLGHRQTRQPD